ncbi:MAG TPA: P-loop NTPase [Chroococcidiopsis sp.]
MPQIVSVQALSHGTGKSNLTANLAMSIAQEGYRVGVIDTGIKPSGIHSLFGLDDDRTDQQLNYYLWNDHLADSDSHLVPLIRAGKGEVAVIGSDVYILPSEVKISDLTKQLRQGFEPTRLSQSFSDLIRRLRLDYLFIDSRPEMDEEALFYKAIADVLLLVLNLDSQTLQGIAVTVDIARKLSVPNILLVANQVLPGFEPNEVKQQLEHTYGEPVAGVLPFYDEMLQLASSDLFCRRYPRHPLSQEIRAIAHSIMGLTPEVQPIVIDTVKPAAVKTTVTQTDSSLSMFDVLALPNAQRQIVNWVLRNGSATLKEIAAHMGEDEATLAPLVVALVDQGFIQQSEEEGELRYQPHFFGRPTQSSSDLWKIMSDDNSGS